MQIKNNQRLLAILTPLLIILVFFTYYHRFPTGDDAWFAEQSYWLLHDGIIRSEFFRGLLSWENQLFVSHKLFLAVGAILMSLFGNSLYVSKLVGLLFFILLIFLLYRYVKQRNFSRISIYWLLFLLFSNTLFIKMSFENRPEMMLVSLGLASFLLIQSERKILILLGGVLAGMAVLTHLNGIIYLIAGFFMLLLTKKIKNAFLFGVIGFLVASLYFYDVWQANTFDIWLFQFRHDPATQDSFGLLSKLKVMAEFPMLFFKSPEQIASSVLLISLLVIFRKRLNELPRNLIIYGLCLLISFWLITKRATGIYQMLFLPTMIILILELFNFAQFSLKKSKIIAFCLFFYLLVGVIGSFQIIYKEYSNPYLPEKYSELSKNILIKANGLVPITFFFNEYKNYSHLRCFDDFYLQMKQQNSKKIDSKKLIEWAENEKLNFILFDYKNDAQDFFPKAGSIIVGFKLIYFDGQFAIYISQK